MIASGAPFRRRDLSDLGLTVTELRKLVAARQVRRLFSGVYVDDAMSDSQDLRVAALALAVNPDQVIVDRTAAWLHGIDTFSAAEAALGTPPVEVCVRRGGTRCRHAAVRGRSRDLAADDVQTIGAIRVTTPLRTVLDLGCHLRRREAFAAMCLLTRHTGLTVDDIVAGSRAFRRRRGVIQLRALAPLVEPRVESHREAWTLLEIIDAGLPRPTPQHWIVIDGVPTYRLDLAYVEARVYVEYDGEEAHGSEEQKQHDHERREWLRQHGWTCVVVRSGDFTGAHRDRWIHELRAALAAAYSTRRW